MFPSTIAAIAPEDSDIASNKGVHVPDDTSMSDSRSALPAPRRRAESAPDGASALTPRPQ